MPSFFDTECYLGPKRYGNFPKDGPHGFELFAPKSHGSVTLKSTDPTQNSVLDCNYIADLLDMLIISEACYFANQIVISGSDTGDIVKRAWPPNLDHHTYKSREEWVPYVKEHATSCYHGGGTCAIGKDNNLMAVLDVQLQVQGVVDH